MGGRSNYDICGCLFAEARPVELSSFPLGPVHARTPHAARRTPRPNPPRAQCAGRSGVTGPPDDLRTTHAGGRRAVRGDP